jgi:hypothetical protein
MIYLEVFDVIYTLSLYYARSVTKSHSQSFITSPVPRNLYLSSARSALPPHTAYVTFPSSLISPSINVVQLHSNYEDMSEDMWLLKKWFQ